MAILRLFCLLLGLLAGATAAAEDITVTSVGTAEKIPATLRRPAGAGPFPAVVLVHDCSGLGPASSQAPARWADELLAQGYVVLIPDSFTPRGFPAGVCTEPFSRSRLANGTVRAGDAYGALAYLRTQPYVDGRRIGLMGGSHGGWTTLAAMYVPTPQADDPLHEAKRHGFAAAIAFYPICAVPYGTWATQRAAGAVTGPAISHSGVYKPVAPVLILIGERDDWTPAQPCEWLVNEARGYGYPMEIKVYPGAFHSFDSFRAPVFNAQRTNGSSPTGRGATTGGDAAAWADAKVRVPEFFARHLK